MALPLTGQCFALFSKRQDSRFAQLKLPEANIRDDVSENLSRRFCIRHHPWRSPCRAIVAKLRCLKTFLMFLSTFADYSLKLAIKPAKKQKTKESYPIRHSLFDRPLTLSVHVKEKLMLFCVSGAVIFALSLIAPATGFKVRTCKL